MYRKRGQISVFIILAIILLVFFFFIMHIRNTIEMLESEENVKKEVDKFSDNKLPLKKFFDQCIISKSRKTIDDIMIKGGAIDENEVLKKGYYFTTGINSTPYTYAKIPLNIDSRYGFNTTSSFGVKNGFFNSGEKYPFFGKIVLPKLCNKDGINSVKSDSINYSCIPRSYNIGDEDINLTIQSRLQDNIKNNISGCIAKASDIELYDFKIEGNGNVSSLFSDNGVIIFINYSIYDNEDKSYLAKGLRYEFPLRVKKLYNTAYKVMQKEIKDFSYEIKEGQVKEDNYISINKTTVDSGILVSMIDYKSKSLYNKNIKNELDINEEFLSFNFFIENRRPFIEPVDDININSDEARYTLPERKERVSLKFYDPDDEYEDYSFSNISISAENIYYLDGNDYKKLDNTKRNKLLDKGFIDDVNKFKVSNNKYNFTFTGNGSDYCYDDDNTIYEVNISVENENKYDYQVFNITLLA
ncbi:MAG: hypothetical protein ACQER9_02310 [Nanobdellota archaeon]